MGSKKKSDFEKMFYEDTGINVISGSGVGNHLKFRKWLKDKADHYAGELDQANAKIGKLLELNPAAGNDVTKTCKSHYKVR